jgi:hypothetical protein
MGSLKYKICFQQNINRTFTVNGNPHIYKANDWNIITGIKM